MSRFPQLRLRRLRRTPTLRSMVRETHLSPANLVLPLFAVEGEGVRKPIAPLPGQFHLSVDQIVAEAQAAWADGVPGIILFGLPASKDAEGSQAWSPEAPVQRAVAACKRALPEMVVMTDVCLCQYTDHGHCGPLKGTEVDNDAALESLARTAVSHAAAGADIVAPSDMMDGRIGALRAALDGAGHEQIPIMSYAAKFASSFYGPFREAADSTPGFGDRRSYQMDYANRREAVREALLDVEEGADLLMVKPGLPYLDILRDLREAVPHPLAVYNVSGEYSMVKAAAAQGWIDEKGVVLELLTGFRRAGADLILTYHAREAARWLA